MRGKLVILMILLVALLATAGSWWYRYQAGRRALVFWGPEAAQRIRNARQVQLLRLCSQPPRDPVRLEDSAAAGGSGWVADSLPDGLSEARLVIDEASWWILDWADISQAAGVINARHSLIEDASFVWDQPRGECPPAWTYAWRFVDSSGQTLILLDLECDRIRRWQTPHEVGLKFGDGLRTFCGEQFGR